MTIPEITKAIAEWGIMLIICAVFLYTVIRIINIYLESLDYRLKNKKHDQLIDVRMSISNKVQSLIDEFLESHNSDRLHVIEFSNSVMSVAYLPFKYMSCTYEVYRIGRNATAKNIDHVSTSLFPQFFEKLYSSDYMILDANKHDPKIGNAIYDILAAGGEAHGLYAILRTARGKALGYVCVRNESGFTDADIEDIQVLASKLSALLGIADK